MVYLGLTQQTNARLDEVFGAGTLKAAAFLSILLIFLSILLIHVN